jgi:DNA transposition AAA+ family ATPase
MRNKLALTKNVAALQVAFEALVSRDAGVPGMGLVHGYTGAGKTTAVTRLVTRTRGVYVRANSGWTPAAMLARIMFELGAEPLHRRAAMLDFIAASMAQQQRPLFVDECDYLLKNPAMLDGLRDVHDLSGVPVVLVGMQGIERRLVHKPQLARRISQWVEFLPSDLEDARTLADTVCEVQLDDDLVARIHAEAKGSIGLMAVGLSRVEALAKANGWHAMTDAHWGRRKLFLGTPDKAAAPQHG